MSITVTINRDGIDIMSMLHQSGASLQDNTLPLDDTLKAREREREIDREPER